MLRCLLCSTLAALALAPAALADGPPLNVVQGGLGVLAPGGGVRYITVGVGTRTTTLLEVSAKNGRLLRSTTYRGAWGIPQIALDGSTGGISRDGRTLVLGRVVFGPTQSRTVFRVLDLKRFRQRRALALQGDFAFDALSPDARRLYVIQHVSADSSRYVVRAVDLASGRLLPGRIADRTQRGWVMRGYAVTRVTGAGGRWVYTLYQNPGGTPFVHALDTVAGVAHCIGIPWGTDQTLLYNVRLSLPRGGRTLALGWRSGRSFLAIDMRTYRIVHPQTRAAGGFPWWTAGLGAAAVLALLAAGLRLAIRPHAGRAAAAGA